MEVKEKKTKKFKWWYVLIAVVVIGIIGSAGKSDDADTTEDAETAAVIETTETPSETEPETISAIESDDVDDESVDNSGPIVEIDTLCSFIQVILDENYENVDVYYDDGFMVVNIWQDGIAAELVAIKDSGGGADNESWVFLKDSLVTLAGSICENIETAGYDDVYLTLNVLNDQNTDNVLLTLLNDTVIYDCLA